MSNVRHVNAAIRHRYSCTYTSFLVHDSKPGFFAGVKYTYKFSMVLSYRYAARMLSGGAKPRQTFQVQASQPVDQGASRTISQANSCRKVLAGCRIRWISAKNMPIIPLSAPGAAGKPCTSMRSSNSGKLFWRMQESGKSQ